MRWQVTVIEEYGWVKWKLPIGVKIMVRRLTKSEWGGRNDRNYGM
jgi:hypothetical protein